MKEPTRPVPSESADFNRETGADWSKLTPAEFARKEKALRKKLEELPRESR
jgi:hypothetical protein